MSELQVTTIADFLGVNKSATETQLKPGEASSMSNWRVTDDKKISKMFGYIHLLLASTGHKINGMWYGSLIGTYHFLYASNAHVYELNLSTFVSTDLGTIIDAFPTTFFMNNNSVYILDGTEYYKWTGSGSIATVVGYTPTMFTASPPAGGGTILEAGNYLTGQKTKKYSGDNTATVYQLPELSIASVDSVYVGGVLQTVSTQYTVSIANGTVTFVTKPPLGVNNVLITWTKVTTGNRQLVTNNMFFGGTYYSRMWLFGNPSHLNTRYPSGVTMSGVSDPTFFPQFGDSNVGDYEITDIKTQYDKQVIFTGGDSSGASSWYTQELDYTDPTTGIITALFPTKPINSNIGNAAKGQVRIIGNNPFSVWKGIYEWSSVTGVLDEKNATWISQRIQPDLDSVNLKNALTFDWNDKGWYLLCVGSRVWVNNYRADVWFVLDLAHTPTCFATIDSKLYFGTADGQIMKFDESKLTYDGTTIDAEWEMGFYNFGVEWIQKFIQRLYISLKPELRSRVVVTYSTDRNSFSDNYTAYYNLLDFAHIDFRHSTFLTSRNPQPFKFKIRAKKIDYFKLKLTSNTVSETATVLSITIPSRQGGEIKKRS
jgi:hypothetical protein